MKSVVLGSGDAPRLSGLYAKAFSGDQGLLRMYRMRPEDLPGFFLCLHEFFFSGAPFMALGLEEGRDLLAGASLMRSDFRANPARFLGATARFSARAGWLRGAWFLGVNLAQAARSNPSQPCWRLLFIGTHPARVGQGLGSRLLKEIFKSLPGQRIQLEVETFNPAARLYERTGFAEVGRFRLRGIPWRVMVREG